MTDKKKYRTATVKTGDGRKRYAEITSDGVTVGCQFVPARVVMKVAAMLVNAPGMKTGEKIESFAPLIAGGKRSFNGRWFTAKIEGVFVRGKINVDADNRVYLCQDEMNGSDADDKFGFKHSWTVRKGTHADLRHESVSDVRVHRVDPLPRMKAGRSVKCARESVYLRIRVRGGGVLYDSVVLYDRSKDSSYAVPNKEVRKIAAILAKMNEPQKKTTKKK